MDDILRDTILRVGEVSGIEGRRVFVKVDKNKNSPDLLFDGKIIKNVSAGSFVEIKKGFLSLFGKVDGETLTEDTHYERDEEHQYKEVNRNRRFLTVSLVGYIESSDRFIGGIKELPLIGNEVFIVTEEKINSIHNLIRNKSAQHIKVARTDVEDILIELPVDGIFNSHIAIFGNTGSGKSNTLAALYQGLFEVNKNRKNFFSNCKFVIFDFNGEYVEDECITKKKCVYKLRTHDDSGDKIPLPLDGFFDEEVLPILVDATEKTQKPFIKRTLRLAKDALRMNDKDFADYLSTVVQKKVQDILLMANKDVAYKLLDYISVVFSTIAFDQNKLNEIKDDVEFHSKSETFFNRKSKKYFNEHPTEVDNTNLFKAAKSINIASVKDISLLSKFYIFLHLQIIEDLLTYKIQNDHVYPVVNRFKSKRSNIDHIFSIKDSPDIWNGRNLIVINLRDVNLDMKKTIPLLIAKQLYSAHKKAGRNKSLSVIVDEAHNILSKASFRETEDWKDYRLETFEEIIKEGRKFGVFLTIASQRPSDISDTIISQAHNYFIHQLINQRDLSIIGNAVSYIDRVTEESIPTLPVGTCIFSGVATPMPLKLKISELSDNQKPQSRTIKFEDLVADNKIVIEDLLVDDTLVSDEVIP